MSRLKNPQHDPIDFGRKWKPLDPTLNDAPALYLVRSRPVNQHGGTEDVALVTDESELEERPQDGLHCLVVDADRQIRSEWKLDTRLACSIQDLDGSNL